VGLAGEIAPAGEEQTAQVLPQNHPAAGLNDLIITSRQTLHIPDTLAVDQPEGLPVSSSEGGQARTFLGMPLMQRIRWSG